MAVIEGPGGPSGKKTVGKSGIPPWLQNTKIQMEPREWKPPPNPGGGRGTYDTPTPYNPYANTNGGGGGGWGGGGGGGGAASYAGMDQSTWDALTGQIRRSKPGQLSANQYTNPAYQSTAFYDWDPSMYANMRADTTSGIAADRSYGNETYDQAAATAQANYSNPYANMYQQSTPSSQDAMGRMFAAQGVGPGALQAVDRNSMVNDQAFQHTMGQMGNAENIAQRGRLQSIDAQRRGMNENLGAQERGLLSQIGMAEGRAKSAYDVALQQYLAGENRYKDNRNMNQAGMNFQRGNQVDDANWGAQNAWSQGIIDPFTQMAMAGMLNGKQTLNLGGMNF